MEKRKTIDTYMHSSRSKKPKINPHITSPLKLYQQLCQQPRPDKICINAHVPIRYEAFETYYNLKKCPTWIFRYFLGYLNQEDESDPTFAFWIKYREIFATASTDGRKCGFDDVNIYRCFQEESQFKVRNKKTGEIKMIDRKQINDFLRRIFAAGKALEPINRDEFTDNFPEYEIVLYGIGIAISPLLYWISASPDFLITNKSGGGECKVSAKPVIYDPLHPTGGIELKHMCQMQANMLAFNRDFWIYVHDQLDDVGIDKYGWSPRCKKGLPETITLIYVERNDEFISTMFTHIKKMCNCIVNYIRGDENAWNWTKTSKFKDIEMPFVKTTLLKQYCV